MNDMNMEAQKNLRNLRVVEGFPISNNFLRVEIISESSIERYDSFRVVMR